MTFEHFHSSTKGRYLRRHAEDVEYWRQRAGWFNDDETMKAYNEGVSSNSNSRGGNSGNSNKQSNNDDAVGSSSRSEKNIVKGAVKGLSVLVALGLALLLLRAIMRRMTTTVHPASPKKEKKRTEARPASAKRSRSRSRTRERKGDYDLMNEEEDKSRKSGRSKSSSRRSRSRSRTDPKRSRSKSRSRGDPKAAPPVEPPAVPKKETVLV